ncbi:glycosyltransferase family 39 protein [Candidatus Moduliflexota bacterium]
MKRRVSLPLLVFLLAVAGRIAALILLNSYRDPKNFDALVIADNLLAGKGFSFPYLWEGEPIPSSFKGPLYVYFIAAFWSFGKSPAVHFLIQAIQAVLGGLTCLALLRIGGQYGDKRVGIVAALFYAFYPPAVFMPSRMHEINFTIPLLAWLLLEFLKLHDDFSRSGAIRTGVAMGLCLLAEPIYGLFCLMVFLYLGFLEAGIIKKRLAALLIAGSFCLIVLAPWSIRNVMVHEKIVLVKTSLGLNLWTGNNPEANGTSRVPVAGRGGEKIMHMHEMMEPELRHRVLSADTEVERDQILLREGADYIRKNPGKAFRLSLRKIKYLWWRHPTHPLAKKGIYHISQLIVFLTGLAGLILALRTNRFFSLMMIFFVVSHTLAYMVFFAIPRYRLIADPPLLLGSAVLFCTLWEGLLRAKGRTPAGDGCSS